MTWTPRAGRAPRATPALRPAGRWRSGSPGHKIGPQNRMFRWMCGRGCPNVARVFARAIPAHEECYPERGVSPKTLTSSQEYFV